MNSVNLRDKGVVQLKCLVKNINVKLSAVTDNNTKNQILCLVCLNNDLLFRYLDGGADVILKKLSWFLKHKKVIQDACFDPSGTWLLIFCLDNTLHIIPALNIVDKSITFQCIFSPNEITSFIVPFCGPHECPNTKKCPNIDNKASQEHSLYDSAVFDKSLKRTIKRNISASNISNDTIKNNFSASKINEFITSNSIYNTFYCDQQPNTGNAPTTNPANFSSTSSVTMSESTKCDNVSEVSINSEQKESKCTTPCDSQLFSCSMISSNMSNLSTGSTSSSCPYPTAVTWWKTQMEENRAILGYSDGAICVVLLANNCPFIGSTVVDKGNIEKLIVCRDNNLDAITLMINTSTKDQYKLLLEQKSNAYIFPNETQEPPKMSDNQSHSIVNKQKSEQEDWEFIIPTASNTDLEGTDGIDENMSLPRMFPASAKARLLSLRDFGAKKIGTLKLKLAESRIKAKEKEKYKNEAAAFAMTNSPTATPEILTTPAGPYFIVQKTPNKSLLSALHSYSDTLSIHNIDISLIPLNLYKLPSHTKHAMLSDKVLYVTQQIPKSGITVVSPTNFNKETPSDNNSCKTLSNSRKLDSMDENLKSIESGIENIFLSNATTVTSQSSHEGDDNLNNNAHTGEQLACNYDNIISVISGVLTSMKIGDDCEFQDRSLLASFNLSNEKIVNIHRMSSVEKAFQTKFPNQNAESQAPNNEATGEGNADVKSTYSKYINLHNKLNLNPKFDDTDRKVLRNEFPKVIFDRCLVVTDKNVYSIELSDTPHVLFLSLANSSLWALCDDFCKTFNLNLAECVEFAGDIFLKRKRIEQALLTYNIARVPPIKTSLKLAMFNEVNALKQISSMALRISYVLDSKYPMNPLIQELIKTASLRHVKYDVILKSLRNKSSLKPENSGKLCSDFTYDSEDVTYDIQMSNSAQFHLSNLLFLTLCEKCVRDKNYMPLWNFITINNKYHTSLSSIILSQSGLYSTAILLAKHRGACLDVFSCLVSASDHVIDIANEMKIFMYNLSDEIFMESIIYLQNYSLDYFEIIRSNMDRFDVSVLERLAKQLDPFDPIYRPILSKIKNQSDDKRSKDLENNFLEFCKTFIETYILILVKLQQLNSHKENFLHALNVFRVTSEERQNYVKLINYSPLSAGFSQCACIADNSVFFWGMNGVNCAMSKNVLQNDSAETDITPNRLEFFKDLNLDVYSVHCGRSHSLILTNNGLYSMGFNQLGQLGANKKLNQSLQPILVKSLDNKIITQICAGQHHNAVVADGQLYTWGWGIYGQLGHGDVYNAYEPKLVEFFQNRKIKQIALGQAHTLVLCYEKTKHLSTALYVFGSNHYGQLGVGQNWEEVYSNSEDNQSEHSENSKDSKKLKKDLVKVSFPLRLELEENIRLIHTNYFSSFAVTESNRLLVWGLSPPELRIINQSRKRARASQKVKEVKPEVKPEMKSESKEEDDGMMEIDLFSDDEPKVSEKPQESAPKSEKEQEIAVEPKILIPEIKIDAPEIVEETASTSDSSHEPIDAPDDPPAVLEEYAEHLHPQIVDTFYVDGDIIYLSSGIYHNALITTKSYLYVWGKNMERQLGRENVKPDLFIPTKHETLEDVKFVECGADFTLVITNDNQLKAFGNNNNGQCGVENSTEKPGNASKLVRFKSSKRVFRIPESTLYIEKPITVRVPLHNLETTINFSSNQPICYLKNLPKFRKSCVIESSLGRSLRKYEKMGSRKHQGDIEEDDHHLNVLNNNKHSSISSVSSIASTMSSSSDSSAASSGVGENSNDLIHYCLFIFQGLYDEKHFHEQLQTRKASNSSDAVEYKVRTLMLSYNYIEAFKLSLLKYQHDAGISIKIFEFFTTDDQIIPMHTEDIKFFVYDVFLHFIRNNLEMQQLENYFLGNVEHYLLQLAFILYFSNTNNNNSSMNQNCLEKQLFEKFKHLYSNFENYTYFEYSEMIFKAVSTKFNCTLCQHLLKYSENFN